MKWTDFVHVSQAATPIVAVVISVIAIMLPAYRERQREKARDSERDLEAKCLATALSFAVHETRTSLSRWKVTAECAAVDGTYQHASPVDLLMAKVEVPSIFTSTMSRVHILGEPTGPSVLRLGAVLDTYNEAVEKRGNLAATNPAISAAEHWKAIAGFIGDVSPILDDILAQIEEVRGSTAT